MLPVRRLKVVLPFVVDRRAEGRAVVRGVAAELSNTTPVGFELDDFPGLLHIHESREPPGRVAGREVIRRLAEPPELLVERFFFFFRLPIERRPQLNKPAEVCEAVLRKFHGVIESGTTTDTRRPLPYMAAAPVRRAREPSRPI